jgi:hypothetical protein
MDDKIKHYADVLYERSLQESSSILGDERIKSSQEMAARRGATALPLSGPEIHTMLKLFVQHIERCMQARLESYRTAYSEAQRGPTDEEFSQILASIQDTQKVGIEHSARALRGIVMIQGRVLTRPTV